MLKRCFCFMMIFYLLSFSGCDSGDPPFKKVLNVPYCPQTYAYYCAAACVQMWSNYDGFSTTQAEVVAWTGA